MLFVTVLIRAILFPLRAPSQWETSYRTRSAVLNSSINRYSGLVVKTSLVAITGGLGTGKTTVLHQLAEMGERTLDADTVVHSLYQHDKELRQLLVQRWGGEAVDAQGSVNRNFVASRIFKSKQERNWLNGVVHPRVWHRITETLHSGSSVLYCAIPLLFEVGWDGYMDASVVVWSHKEARDERLMHQRGWSSKEIEQRERAQMPLDDKLQRADFAVLNSGDISLLKDQCSRLRHRIALHCEVGA